MPARPIGRVDPIERAKSDPRSPYEKIAARIRLDILDGTLPDGATLPPLAELAASRHVSVGTAHRVIKLLETWGLVHVSSGHRTIVTALAS